MGSTPVRGTRKVGGVGQQEAPLVGSEAPVTRRGGASPLASASTRQVAAVEPRRPALAQRRLWRGRLMVSHHGANVAPRKTGHAGSSPVLSSTGPRGVADARRFPKPQGSAQPRAGDSKKSRYGLVAQLGRRTRLRTGVLEVRILSSPLRLACARAAQARKSCGWRVRSSCRAHNPANAVQFGDPLLRFTPG